ncbi:hypothetical protein [Olleya sp. HaHaR_3_96]|uniref:hypothetical protein n=1 Tax=Olleya sp. HaHaR_3_96 TaxID=2745560 RepID=UPI001C4F5293|nr:hypothetical protein [Olleya sp. HaHaR_3_96]QXP58415.1 hypothetical protein H0I26_10835 [Olleya sp. HaHaR_3_96]
MFSHVYSQNNNDFKEFDSCFTSITSQLLIDDVAIKYTESSSMDYKLIYTNVKDSSGEKSIIIGNKDYHLFHSLGRNKINDSISYYLFSHKVLFKGESNYYAYLAIFNKEVLSDFKTIYSNSSSGIEVYNFGSVFSENEFAIFKEDSCEFLYYTIDSYGHIYETDESTKFDNINFKRLKPYEIKLNAKFYKTNKVLLPIELVCKEKPKQILRKIASENLKLKTTFYIDCLKNDNQLTFIYLNNLTSQNDSNIFEIVFDKYDENCVWSGNKSVSKYYIMPNDIEVVNKFTLSSF